MSSPQYQGYLMAGPQYQGYLMSSPQYQGYLMAGPQYQGYLMAGPPAPEVFDVRTSCKDILDIMTGPPCKDIFDVRSLRQIHLWCHVLLQRHLWCQVLQQKQATFRRVFDVRSSCMSSCTTCRVADVRVVDVSLSAPEVLDLRSSCMISIWRQVILQDKYSMSGHPSW